MSEAVAVVGSRRGADLGAVREFVRALHAKHPDTLLVSGGAEGVDKTAEQTWLELGGHVWSFRVRDLGPSRGFGVEMWDLGGETPRCFLLTDHPTFRERSGALFYRNSLIAENADRVVAFYRHLKSPGTQVAVDFAIGAGRDVYEFEAAA